MIKDWLLKKWTREFIVGIGILFPFLLLEIGFAENLILSSNEDIQDDFMDTYRYIVNCHGPVGTIPGRIDDTGNLVEGQKTELKIEKDWGDSPCSLQVFDPDERYDTFLLNFELIDSRVDKALRIEKENGTISDQVWMKYKDHMLIDWDAHAFTDRPNEIWLDPRYSYLDVRVLAGQGFWSRVGSGAITEQSLELLLQEDQKWCDAVMKKLDQLIVEKNQLKKKSSKKKSSKIAELTQAIGNLNEQKDTFFCGFPEDSEATRERRLLAHKTKGLLPKVKSEEPTR